jgi:L-amino acid N-acyltransferase YncA
VILGPMTPSHAASVLEIYQAGIDDGDATFETKAPSWEAFDADHLPDHRFVALDDDGSVLGWVVVGRYSARSVYRGVVEVSVYVGPAARGRGLGRLLLDAVVASAEQADIWTVQAGVFPGNAASMALHRSAGFRVVGTRERIGVRDGIWRDVVLLERRSRRP